LELDDLGNRIFRLHLRAESIRGSCSSATSGGTCADNNNSNNSNKGKTKSYLKNFGGKELMLNSQQLAHEIDKWKLKPVIQVAEYTEQLYRQQTAPLTTYHGSVQRISDHPPCSRKNFLHYPCLRFKNPLYACLLLTHSAMTISLSLIVDPKVGPRLTERVDAAVQICRIYAALGGNHPVGSLTCLASVWWAGLTFEPNTEGFFFLLLVDGVD
jgi:hypothetical protein